MRGALGSRFSSAAEDPAGSTGRVGPAAPAGRAGLATRPLGLLRFALAWCAIGVSGLCLAQPQDVVQGIAAENSAISSQLADGAKQLAQLQQESRNLQEDRAGLDADMQRIERRTAVSALGRELAQSLTERLHQLRKSEYFETERGKNQQTLATTSDANIGVERALYALRDLDAATAERIAPAMGALAPAQRVQLAAAARAGLGEQRDLLARLDSLQVEILESLKGVDRSQRDFEQQTESARTTLIGYLFWMPAAPSPKTIGAIVPSIVWTVSPANWQAAAGTFRSELSRRPFWPAIALLVAIALYASRKRLQAGVVSLAPVAGSFESYRIGHALAALVASFALSLPGALLLWTVGLLLPAASGGPAFVPALGGALVSTAKLLLAVSLLARLLDRRGVAVAHFGGDEQLLGHARSEMLKFAAIFVPLMFLSALNGLDNAPFSNRESLGRLSFSVAMIAGSAFVVRLLRRESPLMLRLAAAAPQSWVVKLHGIWFLVLVAEPLVLAAFAARGYFMAAGYFFSLTLITFFLVLAAGLFYGLLALWVQVQRSRLARSQDQAAGDDVRRQGTGEAGAEFVDVPMARLDIAALGEQTRSLFNVLISLLLLAGIWWVWKDAVPALSTIGNYVLWNTSSTVAGKTVLHPLTVEAVALAVLVLAATAVAVRNVGALLDVTMLQRLEVKADATYAIKVMTRYVLTAVGIVTACRLLGIAWSDLQWLVAAMGVGLGFGLQEIVANFVSGLILLAERPVRIGDVVTIGDVSGTVLRIQARATTVTDFENKEVIIPNKAFITGSVVNWTLTDRITRLAITIGVAYGSDIARVQGLLLGAVAVHPEVLRDPPPGVFLVAFADSAITFQISAYVDSLDKRQRVQHELSLAVERVLREGGIQMPSPHLDLDIRSAPGLLPARPDE